ncbi:hypothetical protein [Halomonas salipaludis]|uniref:XRE family transcriptional regulator n=1 Tax=Halomonas salipaludis TaxID=2032625 RepID=A0A2A2F340_9GAMM|nr:hypothetical protein [Halomonas salipaludis]PAU79200.1 hypothetical protein CK498_02195 [Halomonas salipaludis]
MIISSVSELIDVVGNGRLAAACDVHHATPWHWRTKGLPAQPKRRAQHYRRVLADLAGISTSTLSRLEAGEEIEIDDVRNAG